MVMSDGGTIVDDRPVCAPIVYVHIASCRRVAFHGHAQPTHQTDCMDLPYFL